MPENYENTAGLVNFVPCHTRHPEPKSYLGLDLGQRHDHSALAALELTWAPRGRCQLTYADRYQPELAIRSLTRFPLGTDYDELYQLVSARLALHHQAPRLQTMELVVDAGGPGPPMVDRLRKTLSANVAVRPVIITGGKGQNTLTGGYIGIPRRSLITTLLLTMAAHSLTCEEGLPNWDLFEEELVELRGDTTHPGHSKAHDDLVMAVALALSAAVRDTPQLLPASEKKEREKVRFGFIDKPLL
ncbi:MAG: hypothetical protein ACKV2U_11350 [Bryobacteraceae bacterium]